MDITVQGALLVYAILYFFGFIIIAFTIYSYRKMSNPLYSFAHYFMFNSIGSLGIYYRESLSDFLSIIVANSIMILGAIFLVTGIIKFLNKKIPYVSLSIFLLIFSLLFMYYTYFDFNVAIRIGIYGVVMLLLYVYILVMLYKDNKKNNKSLDLFSFIIIIFLFVHIFRIVGLVGSNVPNNFFEYDQDAIFIILMGTLGLMMSAGVYSLISNRLIDEVKEGERSFSNFIEFAPTPAMIHAEDGEMLHMSKIFTQISGYSKADIPTVKDWIEKAYRENDEEQEIVKNIIKNLYIYKDKKNNNEIEIITKDGRKRQWAFHSSYIGTLPDGRGTAMSVARDITENRLKELEVLKLQEKNRKLLEANRRAIDLANLLVWRMNVEDYKEQNFIYVNNKYKKIMGWTVDSLGLIEEKQFLDSIYPDNEGKEAYNKFIIFNKDIFSNKIDEYVILKFKHIHAITKKVIYLEHHTKVEERFEDGRVKIIGGYVIDITESMKAEEKLMYERNKAQVYLDIIGTMLVALDKNGNITLINKKGCEILEVTEEEVLGKNWFDYFIPEKISEDVKNVFKNVFSKDSKLFEHYENVVITSSGKERVISWYNAIHADIDGKIVGIISSGEDITEKKQYEESLRIMGYQDALTGLYNRRYYEEALKELDIEYNLPLTIAMGDINGLKLINDAFGHNAGDELLISAANVIQETSRDTDLAARIGGDEFVLVMPKTSELEAEKVISDIHGKLKMISIESIQLSISFGTKTKVDASEDIQEVYRSAEDLMYREKLLEIPSMRSGAIETILNTLYEKDKNSEIHSRTVSILCENIAKACGMNRQDIAEAKTAGLLHDIGKIIISLSIINKEGKLTTTEYNSIKTHSEIGFRILNSTSDMRGVSNIVLSHHERWDGNGYPRGIKEDEIPLKSRIIAIADAYDAMTSERTYRSIVTKEEALEEIVANSGTQFDPELVKIFDKHFEKITKI